MSEEKIAQNVSPIHTQINKITIIENCPYDIEQVLKQC